MMQNKNVLYSTDKFDIVTINDVVGIHEKISNIAVLPYVSDANGMIKEICIQEYKNPFRPGGIEESLLTEVIEYEDDSLLYTAKKCLSKNGYNLSKEEDNKRFLFLGGIFLNKYSDSIIPVFACDVTHLERENTNEQIKTINISNGIASDDGLLLSAFLRLFNYMYSKL